MKLLTYQPISLYQMTKVLKQDIKTIIEVVVFIVVYMSISTFLSGSPWIYNTAIVFFLSYYIYSQYYKRFDKNIIVFSTQNDTFFRMIPISIGILVIIISVIGYLAAKLNIQKVILDFAIGAVIIALGYFQLPKGWLSVENNSLKLYGIRETIDTRQLKEIVLKNNKITLTNIYDESKYSRNLKLDPLSSEKIKKFLQEKLLKKDIVIMDNVIETA